MARKKKSETRLFIIKFLIIGLLASGIGFLAGKKLIDFSRNADYFKVQSILIDPSLDFIDKGEFRDLIGKNIFGVDLKALQRLLSRKYAQASQLKVIRHFPNRLYIAAKPRLPLAQINLNGKAVILDDTGVVLASGAKDGSLPLIVGVNPDEQNIFRRLPLKDEKTQAALAIIRFFRNQDGLSAYPMTQINIENLSKIVITLSNKLEVIMDQTQTGYKLRVLDVVLSQGNLDFKHVKYVDLRFKEPIIGTK